MQTTTKFAMLLASTLTLTAAPALADATLGLGLTVAFGGQGPEAGVGARVFSNDKQDSLVASIGADYMFTSRELRATVGGAYLDRDLYLGGDLGWGASGSGTSFGLSAGVTNTRK